MTIDLRHRLEAVRPLPPEGTQAREDYAEEVQRDAYDRRNGDKDSFLSDVHYLWREAVVALLGKGLALDTAVSRCDHLAAKYVERFAPLDWDDPKESQ